MTPVTVRHLQLADVVDGLLQEGGLVQLVLVRDEVPQLVEPAERQDHSPSTSHTHMRTRHGGVCSMFHHPLVKPRHTT